MNKDELSKEVFEALGAASVAWLKPDSDEGGPSVMGGLVFDSTLAKEIGDKLVDKIWSALGPEEEGVEFDTAMPATITFYGPAAMALLDKLLPEGQTVSNYHFQPGDGLLADPKATVEELGAGHGSGL